MSFKIVKEFRKPGYIIIPEGFENNGVYWYPPQSWSTKKRHNLLRNKFYLPDKVLWEARPCVVKKSRIPTYELAEEEEEKLLKKHPHGSYKLPKEDVIVLRSDESSDEESLLGQTKHSRSLELKSEPNISPKRKKSRSQSIFSENLTKDVKVPITFINDEMWDCFENTSSACNFRCRIQSLQNSAIASASTITPDIPATNNNYELLQHSLNGKVNKKEKDNNPDCDSECDSIGFISDERINCHNSTDVLSKILKSQQQHQEEIGRQLQELKRYIQDGFSTIFMELQTLRQIPYSNSAGSDFYPKKFLMENFKKVSTWDEANQLEQMLMVSEFKADMIEKISNSIGSKGSRIGEGLECCQHLMEILFQKDFLNLCSWIDATTKQKQIEEARISLFQYQNIISFITSVIINLDPEFSFDRMKEFLQSSSNQNQEGIHPRSIENNTLTKSCTVVKRKLQTDQESVQEKSNKKEKPSNNIDLDSKIDKLLEYANNSLSSVKEAAQVGNDGGAVKMHGIECNDMSHGDEEIDRYLEETDILGNE